METREISSFVDLDQSFEEFHRFQGWVYRGQADADWLLIPKLARAPIVRDLSLIVRSLGDHINEVEARMLSTLAAIADRFQLPGGAFALSQDLLDEVEQMRQKAGEITKARQEAVLVTEQRSLEHWKKVSLTYLRERPANDWEWLAIGQHYGLKTRMLDWTSNPLAATFFALCETRDAPAAIYALRCARGVDVNIQLTEFKGVAMYSPPRTFDRIIRQHGLFSVTEDPCRDLSNCQGGEAELIKLVVPESLRELLLRKIVSYGIDRSTLFPDLDGAAAHINWCLDHPALLAKGDPHLDRALESEHERLKVLMEAAVRKLSGLLLPLMELSPNPTPAAGGEAASEG